MTNEKKVLQTLGLLSGLKGWPRSEGGRQALVLGALAFKSEHQFQKFVTDWMRHEVTAPTPSDLFSAAGAKRGDDGLQTPHFHCTVCYDTGKTSTAFLVWWQDGRKYHRRLTPAEEAALWEKHLEAEKRGDRTAAFAPGKQMIFEGPVRCACQREVQRMPLAPQERDRYEREQPGGAA